jgi:hypothetical protein
LENAAWPLAQAVSAELNSPNLTLLGFVCTTCAGTGRSVGVFQQLLQRCVVCG